MKGLSLKVEGFLCLSPGVQVLKLKIMLPKNPTSIITQIRCTQLLGT